jgi:hypothetical protein
VTTGPNGLFHGERVLWVGTPARLTVLDRVGKFWLGLGAFYGLLFAVLAVVMVRAGNPNQLILTALMMVCILGVVVAALLQLRSGRRSTRYLITDQRIIHTSRWFGQDKVRIAALRELGPPAVSVPDGSTLGTIRFGNRTARDEAVDAISSLGQAGSIVLKDIDNVQQVRDIILAAQTDTR